MATYKYLEYEVQQGIATIRLNRPEVYNALNDEITYELQDAFKGVAKDDVVRVVVLTGNGKAFCSGQDLKAASAATKRSFSESLHKRYNPLIRLMRNLPKPIVCRLNGVAAGAGCSIALACDIIIAAEDASLVQSFVNIGLVPDSGSSYFVPRLIGRARAFEFCAMGPRISASQAMEWGLVNRSVPTDMLDETVMQYAMWFSTAPTKAIGLVKKMLNKSETASIEDMLEYEAWCQEIAGTSGDYKEGVAAFIEKRKPNYRGR